MDLKYPRVSSASATTTTSAQRSALTTVTTYTMNGWTRVRNYDDDGQPPHTPTPTGREEITTRARVASRVPWSTPTNGDDTRGKRGLGAPRAQQELQQLRLTTEASSTLHVVNY